MYWLTLFRTTMDDHVVGVHTNRDAAIAHAEKLRDSIDVDDYQTPGWAEAACLSFEVCTPTDLTVVGADADGVIPETRYTLLNLY